MNIKRIIPACLSLLALGLASCVDTNTSTEEPKHTHTFASEWSKDSNGHWHACTGEGCEVVSGNEEHHGGSATCTTKAVCEDCGESYGELLAHTYDQKVVKDTYLKSAATHSAKATYFYSCTCGEKGTETFEVGETVAHSKAESWSSDANNHWKACTAEGCEDIKLDSEAHKLVEKVDAAFLKSEATHSAKAVYYKSCETCGYKSTETFENGEVVAHTPSAEWTTNETNHWHTCTTTGCESVKLDDAAHNYDQKVMTETYKASAATCTANETYYFSCVCGVKGTTTFEKEETMLQHDYNTAEFEADGTNHWHKCNDCTATTTPEQHTIVEEGNVEKCSVCGYVAHTHVWAEELTKGETTHWYACTVNNCLEKKDEEAHTYEAQGTTVKQQQSCTSPELIAMTCDCGAEHETETWQTKPALGHDESGKWLTDTTNENHYKICGNQNCGAEILKGAHEEETAATCHSLAVCGVCNKQYGTMKDHTFGQEFVTNEFGHWHECSAAECDEKSGYANHTFNPKDNKCTGCGEVLTPTYATKTIAELAALTAKETTVYKVTGVVNGIYGPEYGNFYLIDPETGAEILVYGLAGIDKDLMKCKISNTGLITSDYSSSGKNFEATGVKDGDKITILATVGYYSNKSQLIAVLYENHGKYEGAAKTLSCSFDESRGSVVLSPTTANIGDTITVTVTPSGDYIVGSVKVYNGSDAKNYSSLGTVLAETAPGVYTFTADLLNNIEVVFSAGPAVISTKSITELSKLTSKDNTVVEVVGLVYGTYNTQYGNLYLVDLENGNKILVYGLANADALTMTDSGEGYFTGEFSNNKSFASLNVKDGDVIKVNAIVAVYNNAVQLNAVFVEKLDTWESGDFEVTANATDNGTVVPSVETAKYGETVTLTLTPAEGYKVGSVKVNQGDFGTLNLEAVEGVYSFDAKFVNEVTVNFVDENQENVPVEKTVTLLIADYADDNSWENSVKYPTINIDSVVSVTATGGGNTGKYYTSGEQWRTYQSESPSVTFNVVAGYELVSVKITYATKNTGILIYGDNQISSGSVVTVSGSSAVFNVGNTNTETTNGQVNITKIEVVYKTAE